MGRESKRRETVPGVSIWRRKADGPRAKWKVTYPDPASGKPVSKAVSADYSVTVAFARQIIERRERLRLGLIKPAEDRWLEQDRKPLEEHLKEYERALKAAALDYRHVRQMTRYVRRVFFGTIEELEERQRRGHQKTRPPVRLESLGFDRMSQIRASVVYEQIGRIKAAWSGATANRYLDAVNAFLNWGVGERWQSNVCAGLRHYDTQEDRRVERRVIEPEQFAQLIQSVAQSNRNRGGLTPAQRSLLYRFTLATGLRRNEVRNVRVVDLVLSGARPGVWTRAKISRKNKKRLFIEFAPLLAQELARSIEGKAPADHAIPCPTNTARMLKADLAAAGIAYKTVEGVFDFHAIRHLCGTMLMSGGVNPKAVQQHMRHSRITLTLDTYGHLLDKDRSATAMAIPDFGPKAAAEETGQIEEKSCVDSTAISKLASQVQDSPSVTSSESSIAFSKSGFDSPWLHSLNNAEKGVSGSSHQIPRRHSATPGDTETPFVCVDSTAPRHYRFRGLRIIRRARVIRDGQALACRRSVGRLLAAAGEGRGR